MWRPLRRFLGVAALACGGMTACGPPPPEEPTLTPEAPEAPASPVEPAPTLPQVPPVREERACPRPPPGSLPTEALQALAPASSSACGSFPGACGPEPLRRTFAERSARCAMRDPNETVAYFVEYDTRGRITSYEGLFRNWHEHQRYDACGRLEYRSVDVPGLGAADDFLWRFGPDGRLLDYTQDWGNTRTITTWLYSESGQPTLAETKSYYSGYTIDVRRQRYTYDAQGRIVRTEHEKVSADGGPAALELIEERTYEDSGALSELRVKTPSGVTTSVRTFSEGRLVREETFSGSRREERGWTYRPDGLLEKSRWQSEDAGKTSAVETVHVYDEARRLEQEEHTSTSRAADGTETRTRRVERYVYDAEGNLRSRREVQPETGETFIEWRYEGTCY